MCFLSFVQIKYLTAENKIGRNKLTRPKFEIHPHESIIILPSLQHLNQKNYLFSDYFQNWPHRFSSNDLPLTPQFQSTLYCERKTVNLSHLPFPTKSFLQLIWRRESVKAAFFICKRITSLGGYTGRVRHERGTIREKSVCPAWQERILNFFMLHLLKW